MNRTLDRQDSHYTRCFLKGTCSYRESSEWSHPKGDTTAFCPASVFISRMKGNFLFQRSSQSKNEVPSDHPL